MLFFLLLILTFITDALGQMNTCPVYSCEKLEQNICSIKDMSKYQLQECPHYYSCNFKQEDKSSCVLAKYEYSEQAYIGGKCEKDFDCLSNKCNNYKCEKEGEKGCESNDDCEFGLHCKSNQCIAPAIDGDKCELDEDCQWPLGCFKGKCTKYFSIKNNEEGDDAKPFFCESGRSYSNQCNSIKDSVQTSCNDKKQCSYQDTRGNYITLNDACVCTISAEPTEICKPGDADNPYWKTVLKLLKQSINFAPTPCNAKEKRPGFCRESLRTDWDLRSKNIELTKSMLLAENAPRMDKTVPCSLKSILQFDDTPPKPQNEMFKCPIYLCNENKAYVDDKTCAYSENPFNKEGDSINVALQRICSKGYKCDYQSKNIYLNWTTNATCEEIPTQKSWRYKYSGEDCTSHSQCLPGSNGEAKYCIDGICSGENNECKDHSDCFKGYFCNGFKCQKQKKENKQCLEQYECYNYFGCLNNTCVKYYSLPNGTYLNKTFPDSTLCQMGKINKESNQCAETDYYELEAGQKNEDGFVECKVGQLCNYTTGYFNKNKPVVITTVCECGFREVGKAYCPIPQTVNQNEWKKYFKLRNSQYDNNCHTLRRSQCIEEFSDSNRDDLYYYQRKTINAHLFYESTNCIIEILSSMKSSHNNALIALLGLLLIMN